MYYSKKLYKSQYNCDDLHQKVFYILTIKAVFIGLLGFIMYNT